MNDSKKEKQKSQKSADAGLLIGIERVIELSGARSPINPDKKTTVYAHIARPLGIKEYALLAVPSGNFVRLGLINPDTRIFEFFEPRLLSLCGYATNKVVNRISVFKVHLDYIQTLKEVLSIKGIQIKKITDPTLPTDIKEILGVYKGDYYRQEATNFKYVAMTLYVLACFAEDRNNTEVAVRLKTSLVKYISLLKAFSDFRADEFKEYHMDRNEHVEDYVNRMHSELMRKYLIKKEW